VLIVRDEFFRKNSELSIEAFFCASSFVNLILGT
jgi:hypothetical protein